MDVSASVRHLADQLGVTVDWSKLHANAASPQVVAFIALAARVAFATAVQQVHDQQIGDALDTAAGAAGTDNTDLPALLCAVSMDQGQRRDEAVTQARALLGDLVDLGVLR